MSYLTSASPYGYLQNEIIIAKVKAYNIIGAGPEGTPNTSGIAGQIGTSPNIYSFNRLI